MRLASFARVPLAAAFIVLGASACKDPTDPPRPVGLRVVGGGAGSDTVEAIRAQALVVEVRDSAGRPMPETVVHFEMLPPVAPKRPNALPMVLCEVNDVGCDGPALVIAASTTTAGRASVQLRHGALAGNARVRITVPDIGAVDTVTYTTLPGNPVGVLFARSDTAIVVGQSMTLPAAMTRYDRYDNEAGLVPATILGASANLQRQDRTVTGASVGHGFVEVDAGGARDTIHVYVVPTGRLALVSGNSVVVADFAGGGRQSLGGLQAVGQYGLRPSWVPGTSRLVVHSGVDLGRLYVVDPPSGGITALPTNASLRAQWYPDAAAGWIHFTGETTTGRYGVWRVHPDGTGLEQVPATTPDYGDYYRPTLSPDGSRIAVSVYEAGNIGVRVFSYPALTPVSPFVGNATAPRWSPDGQWLAFSTPGFSQLRVMRPDGSGLRAVSSANFGEWFDWTNDSQWLVANDGRRMTLVGVATGEVLALPWTFGMWQPAVAR